MITKTWKIIADQKRSEIHGYALLEDRVNRYYSNIHIFYFSVMRGEYIHYNGTQAEMREVIDFIDRVQKLYKHFPITPEHLQALHPQLYEEVNSSITFKLLQTS
jgi:Na+/phosphate symporter